jgi:hypothetical protein
LRRDLMIRATADAAVARLLLRQGKLFSFV